MQINDIFEHNSEPSICMITTHKTEYFLRLWLVANRYPSLSPFLPRDLLESGIGKEEKAMKKLQSVLTRLKARQAHQASLYQEAKAELHKFRVGWILSVVFRSNPIIPIMD